MNTNTLVQMALERTCPAGEPHTGDAPEEDHGHTDCWIYHKLITKVIQLEEENAKLVSVLMGPYVNVNESHVEEVDALVATYIGRLEVEKIETFLPPKKCESHNFSSLWWDGLV